jgi:hypothetical protein
MIGRRYGDAVEGEIVKKQRAGSNLRAAIWIVSRPTR